MTSVEGLAVALLASGRSSRFGRADKLAAPLGGKPLIQWAAEAGRTIHAAQHVMVAPDAHLLPDDYVHLANAHAAEGMAASLRIAARHARETHASALLILLADMPFVRTQHLTALIEAYVEHPERSAFSRAPGGAPQPPAIIPAAMFPVLESLSGDSGARALARGASFVEAAPDGLIDVDTQADLALCAQLIGA